jgi:hypothetical protein
MSGGLNSEFVRLLFLLAHRETGRFFATSGLQLAQSDRDQFHFCSSQIQYRHMVTEKIIFIFYYESIKWELKTRPINECQCDERIKTQDVKTDVLLYDESINRELKTRPINECQCDERLKTKAEESTRLRVVYYETRTRDLKIRPIMSVGTMKD